MKRRKAGRPKNDLASVRARSERVAGRVPGRVIDFEAAREPRKTGSFDLWLDYRLKEMYGAVVEEPLPDDLKALVDKLTGDHSSKEEGDDEDR